MKISKKRFEEILLEEVKVFVQEKKLEEQPKEGRPQVDSEAYKEQVIQRIASMPTPEEKDQALEFAMEQGYIPEKGQYGYEDTWTWDKHEDSAGPESSWFGKLFGALSETNEGLGQTKKEFTRQARLEAGVVDEACGDVEHEHGAIKIKIKKGYNNV